MYSEGLSLNTAGSVKQKNRIFLGVVRSRQKYYGGNRSGINTEPDGLTPITCWKVFMAIKCFSITVQ